MLAEPHWAELPLILVLENHQAIQPQMNWKLQEIYLLERY